MNPFLKHWLGYIFTPSQTYQRTPPALRMYLWTVYVRGQKRGYKIRSVKA